MSKKSKPTFFEQFKDSIYLRPVIKKLWVRQYKPKVCKHCNEVTSKSMLILVNRQMKVIQSLAESIAKLEDVMTDRQHLINDFLMHLNEMKHEKDELKKRLEVMRHAH